MEVADSHFDVFDLLVKYRKSMFAITVVFSVASVLFALSIPNQYRATALLVPAEANSGGISNLMRQYGGLASLAGVSLPTQNEADNTQLGIEILQSRSFLIDFVDRRDIKIPLMASERWDPVSGLLTLDDDIYSKDSKKWVRRVNAPLTPEPSSEEVHRKFKKILSVNENRKTGFVTISITHHSPELAATWLTWLIEDINELVRFNDVSEAERSIEYLREQINGTPLAELRAVFFELIESQTETIMLANVRSEYVFKTVDPAVAPQKKSAPNRALLCIVGFLFGCLISFFYCILRGWLVRDSKLSCEE